MRFRRVEHGIDHKRVRSAKTFKLFELRNHGLGRPAAMACSLDNRVGAITAAVGTAALCLDIQNATALQVTGGKLRWDRLRPGPPRGGKCAGR